MDQSSGSVGNPHERLPCSTMIQMSSVHTGRSDPPLHVMENLLDKMVPDGSFLGVAGRWRTRGWLELQAWVARRFRNKHGREMTLIANEIVTDPDRKKDMRYSQLYLFGAIGLPLLLLGAVS